MFFLFTCVIYIQDTIAYGITLCHAYYLGRKNQVAFTKNIMPNKLRIITHLVTKPTKKPFSLLNHVKEVKENIRNGKM